MSAAADAESTGTGQPPNVRDSGARVRASHVLCSGIHQNATTFNTTVPIEIGFSVLFSTTKLQYPAVGYAPMLSVPEVPGTNPAMEVKAEEKEPMQTVVETAPTTASGKTV
jgi:hypothetical protein